MMRRLITCLAAATLLALPAPASAQQQPAPIAPATLASWSQSLQLLQQLEAAVGSLPTASTQSQRVDGIATDLIGWTLAAVGLAVDEGSGEAVAEGLQQISSDLNGVQNTLNSISDQLAQMSAELQAISEQEQWATCAELTQNGSQPAAVIQAAAAEYTQFLTQSTNASASEPAPQMDALVDWATEYTADNNLATALTGIDLMLQGSATNGSLASCGAALFDLNQQPNLTFEAAYFEPLYQYLSYWYQMQVLGLNLYVEAQHALALDAAGELTGVAPTDPYQICTKVINGDVTQACNLAYGQVTSVWDSLEAQMYQAGAPYLWGTGGMVTAPLPSVSNKAWLVDLNDFQPGDCPLPLSSTGPACGGAAGTTGGFAQSTWGPFSWGAYAGWQPARTADWFAMFPPSSQTNSQYKWWQSMVAAGFGDPSWGTGAGLQNLILYTGEVTSSTNDNLSASWWNSKEPSTVQNSVTGMCLIDTSAQPANAFWKPAAWIYPLCDDYGGGMLSVMVNNFNTSNSTWNSAAPGGANGTYVGGGPFTQTAFYNADFSAGPKGLPWWVNTVPGWMTGTLGLYGDTQPQALSYQPAPQYRWPVLPLSQSMCTATVPGTGQVMSLRTAFSPTAAGPYTMCGEDFEAWSAAQLPPQPLPGPAVSVVAEARLGAARLSWKAPRVHRHVTGYRVRGRLGDGQWRTLKTVQPGTGRAVTARVPVKRAGWWRFNVVTVERHRVSRPSRPSRPEYVSVSKHAARFYTFRRGDVTRIAKSFSDGRVYFAGRHRAGVGERHKSTVRGHTYRGPHRWTGRWVQQVSGSWKDLRWDGWTRVQGPAATRRGMPLPKAALARW